MPDLSKRPDRDRWVRSRMADRLAIQVQAIRKQREWSRRQLAEMAGISESSVLKIERPSGRTVKLDTILKIAAAFDVSLSISFESFGEAERDRPQALLTVPSWGEEHRKPGGSFSLTRNA